jgi:DNA-binding NarL/FixJ family response regulator
VTPSVLLVDDDPAFRALATRILNEIGIEVVAVAGDAAAAVAAAKSLKPDAALVDVGLPDRDGVQLAYELAALPWRPRVVLTSSDSDAADGIEAPAAGEHMAFIAKEQLPNAPLRRLLTAG